MMNYSTVTEYLDEWVLYQILSFDLTLSSQNLRTTRYSKYQYYLYTKITYLQKKGMNYVEIANWLNLNGYKTTRGNTFDQITDWLNKKGYLSLRGKTFNGNHVHSIVKKKRLKDEKLEREYPEVWSDFYLDIYDKTLVNMFEGL